MMISEFRDLKDAVRFASLSLETLSAGMFVKVGKRIERKREIYWVMVPVDYSEEVVVGGTTDD